MICIVKSVTEDYSLLQRGVARNGKFKPRLDIGPLGNGCFISRISVVQLRWASLRNAVLWQNFAAAVVAPSRFSFNVNEARNQKGGRGGGREANEITNARWCHANIFSPRYNFAWSAAGRKIAFAPILQPDGSMNHTSARESHVSKDYHYEPLTRNI